MKPRHPLAVATAVAAVAAAAAAAAALLLLVLVLLVLVLLVLVLLLVLALLVLLRLLLWPLLLLPLLLLFLLLLLLLLPLFLLLVVLTRYVRVICIHTLSHLPPALLLPYADAFAELLSDSNDTTRLVALAALKCLDSHHLVRFVRVRAFSR